MIQEDLTFGEDIRGDHALFIEEKHFGPDDVLDEDTKSVVAGREATFFRVIRNGEETSSHGWIEYGEVMQWG